MKAEKKVQNENIQRKMYFFSRKNFLKKLKVPNNFSRFGTVELKRKNKREKITKYKKNVRIVDAYLKYADDANSLNVLLVVCIEQRNERDRIANQS